MKRIQNKEGVIVHCSDGWDRTAQLTSLTMLCVDPYLRSGRGFAELVEREFVALGHKFQTRSGLPGTKPANASQKSPIFLQFLDCVYQILRRYPDRFEFTSSFLLMLAEQHTLGVWSTFSADDEATRLRLALPSIWPVCMDQQLYRANYERSSWNKTVCTLGGRDCCSPLDPAVAPWDIRPWWSYWARNHPCSLQWLPFES